MTTINFPIEYLNGNVHVRLWEDGTKHRWYDGDPVPVLPESVDLKITNWCDGGCHYCHENSTVTGKHAAVETIAAITEGMIPGTEVAIGGGDPLSHPQIEQILELLVSRGLVPNLTVNGQHIHQYQKPISRLRALGLVYGLGISYTGFYGTVAFQPVVDDNTVFHVILGKNDPQETIALLNDGHKVLVLGYKQHGRGANVAPSWLSSAIDWWRFWLRPMLSAGFCLAFDNLAIEQLDLKEVLPRKCLEAFYMGGDGEFTMYADAVEDTFAKSSTSFRIPREGRGIGEMFEIVRSGKNE